MIVNSLVHGVYASVARMTGGRLISGPELERIVAEHALTVHRAAGSAYTDDELTTVASVVQVLVEKYDEHLREIGAYDHGDRYAATDVGTTST